MKPQTLEVMTNLSVKAINEDLKPLADAAEGLVGCDGSDLHDLALNCRNIADVAEALENVFLTAADETDRIEAAAADMAAADNIQMMTEEEHSESHNFKGGRYA